MCGKTIRNEGGKKIIKEIIKATEKAIANPEFMALINIKKIMMVVTGLLKNIVTG
ncbi:MAG: hypothetical protein ABIR03_13150 [Ginsengibacter sp.]